MGFNLKFITIRKTWIRYITYFKLLSIFSKLYSPHISLLFLFIILNYNRTLKLIIFDKLIFHTLKFIILKIPIYLIIFYLIKIQMALLCHNSNLDD